MWALPQSATVALDTLEYTAALPDVVLSTGTQEQPGGWLPIKYVDRDGNVVDLDDVEEAVEEIAETAPSEAPGRSAAHIGPRHCGPRRAGSPEARRCPAVAAGAGGTGSGA